MDQTVRVLSTLALKGAVQSLAGQYLAASGVRIDADFAPTLERMRRGEVADVVILTREGLAELAREGSVVAASCVDLARSYVGIAVKAGAVHPDIATEPALRAALLAARAPSTEKVLPGSTVKPAVTPRSGRNSCTQAARTQAVSGRALTCVWPSSWAPRNVGSEVVDCAW